MKAKPINQMFKVPNSIEGKYFIELLKKYKSPCYSVRTRGRTLSEKKLKKALSKGYPKEQIKEAVAKHKRWRNCDGSMPLSLSDNIGIYMDCKVNGITHTVGADNVKWDIERQKELERLIRYTICLLKRHGRKRTNRECVFL